MQIRLLSRRFTGKMLYAAFIILLTWLSLYPSHAQEEIYLPLITKENWCSMPNLPDPILRISDGTTTIDFLEPESGFHLEDPGWRPRIAQYKGGGTYQESSLAQGKRLVQKEYDTVIESIPLTLKGRDQANAIKTINTLLKMLTQSSDHWTVDYDVSDVWLEVRPSCNNTNTGYAQILKMEIPELGDSSIFGAPFFNASEFATLTGITLVIEREPLWRALAPGQSDSPDADSKQLWDYNVGWQVYDSLGSLPDLPAPGLWYLVTTVGSDGLIVGPLNVSSGNMYYSTDKGDTWAASTGGSSVIIRDILKISDSLILFSDGANSERILKTVDGGANITVASTDVGGGPMVRLPNGNILTVDASGGDDIYRSTDNGDNWSLVGTLGTSYTVTEMAVSPVTGTVIAHIHVSSGGGDGISVFYRSINEGADWTPVLSADESRSIFSDNLISDSDGGFYTISLAGEIRKSDDDGITWSIINTSLNGLGTSMFEASDGSIYAATNSNIYKSTDEGSSFVSVLSSTAYTNAGTGAINWSENSDGDLFAGLGKSGSVGGLVYKLNDAEQFGTSTDDKLYLANKQNIAQLSHIFTDDGGSFSSNLFPISAAFSPYPASPAVNDAIYFGSQSSLTDSGPFGGLRLYITIPITITDSYTILWEYWNGSAWTSLSVQDNTNGGVGAFSQIGYNSINWQQPSNWATTSVNSVTAYWVRARISAISGTLTSPTHGNADIIAFNVPFAEILADQVGGTDPALLRLKVRNESGNGGPGGSEPLLYDNRVLIGLRSYSRGANFQAYLNASDEQNPFGVTVTAGTNTSFANDLTTPTGRRATYNPGGVEAMATRLTFTLNSNIAAHYYGTFHAFLRGRRTAGSATDISVRLQVETGSGGVIFTTKGTKEFQSTTAWEVLDFGQIEIPVGSLKQTEIGDNMAIRVQASAASGTPDLYIYDIILMPVDEWAIDAVDFANESDSHIGLSSSIPRLLDVDSLTDSKRQVRSIVKQANANERVVSIYDPISNGPAILQANARQKLWFLAMKTSTTGTSYNWISEPEVVHSLQLFKNQRYLALRGTE